MKKVYLTVLFIIISIPTFAQDFEWGGQIRIRGVAEENFALDTNGSPNIFNEYDFRQRSRLYARANFDDMIGFFEIENNSRWGFKTNTPNEANDPDELDEAGELYINNVFVNFPVPILSMLAPTYAQIGRQYFILGRGLVIDIDSDDAPDPLDGARVTTHFSRHLMLDLMYSIRRASKQRNDQKLMGGFASLYTDRNHILPDQHLFPYTFYQRDRRNLNYQDNKVFSGMYMEGELPYFLNILNIDRIKYRMEYSHQWGNIDSSGGRSITNYNGNAFYADVNIRRDFVGGLQLKLKGMYFVSTGNRPNVKDIELFRSDYQNFRPGELFGEEEIGSPLIRSIYSDERFGRGGSNMQVINGGIELEYKDLQLEFEIFNYLANQVPSGVSNKIGNEYDLKFEWQYTNRLSATLKAARFVPGTFFGENIKPANEVEMEIKFDF